MSGSIKNREYSIKLEVTVTVSDVRGADDAVSIAKGRIKDWDRMDSPFVSQGSIDSIKVRSLDRKK